MRAHRHKQPLPKTHLFEEDVMNMMAARLYGKNDLRVEQMPVPEIGDDEILLKVKAAAICGTDLRMLSNGVAWIDELHPLVLCHEFAGIIEQVGANVPGYGVGQRVSVATNIGCGICNRCVSGKSHHCVDNAALGINIDGGFAEYVRIPATAVRLGNVTLLGDNVSYEAAAANEAFSCAYSSFERYRVTPGDTVVIIGAGAIGLMHASLAKMAGAGKVIMNDLSQARLNECSRIMPWLIPAREKLAEVVEKETDGAMADVVITACSAAQAQQAAFSLAGLDARVNFFGGLPRGKEIVELDTNQIHYKQLQVSGTTRASHFHYRQTLRFISVGVIDLDPLITHRYPLAKIGEAFDNTAKTIGLKQAILFE